MRLPRRPVRVLRVLVAACALGAAGVRAQEAAEGGKDGAVVSGLVAQRVFVAPPGTELNRAAAFGERLYLAGTGGVYVRRGARWDTLAPLREALVMAMGRGTLLVSGLPPDSLRRTLVTAGDPLAVPRRFPSDALDELGPWQQLRRGPTPPLALTDEGLMVVSREGLFVADGAQWRVQPLPGYGRLVQGGATVWLLVEPAVKDGPTRLFAREDGGWRALGAVAALLGASPAPDVGWAWTERATVAIGPDGAQRRLPWPEADPPVHVLPRGRAAWAVTNAGRLYRVDLDAEAPAWRFVLRVPLRYPAVEMLAAPPAGDPARLFVVARDEAFAVVEGAWPGYTRATDAANLRTNDACPFFADLDGDGDADLLTLSTQRGLDAVPTRLYANDGRGRFSEVPLPLAPPVDVALRAARVADLDGDGRPDLALLDDRGRLLVLRNRGRLRFAAPRVAARVAGPRPGPAAALRALDADRDGDLDLVVPAADPDRWTFFSNDGVGRFEARRLAVRSDTTRGLTASLPAAGGATPLPVLAFGSLLRPGLLLDLDDDARREWVAIDPRTGGAAAAYRLGAGTPRRIATLPFPEPLPAPQTGASQLAVGDADLDGRADIIYDGRLALNAGGRLAWSTGAFVPAVSGPAAFADVDGDGDLDLFVGSTASEKEGRLGQLFVNGLHQPDEAAAARAARRGVRVRLRGASSNRLGIGTLVRVYDGAGLLRAEGVAGYAADDLAVPPPDEVAFAAPPPEDGPFRVEAVFPSGARAARTVDRLPAVLTVRERSGMGWPLARLGWTARLNARRLPGWALGLQLLFVVGLVAAPVVARKARRIEWPAWALPLAPVGFVVAWLWSGPVSPVVGGLVPLAVGAAALAGAAALVRAVERGSGRFAHYRLFEELGRGGAGRVVRARDLVDRAEVALKVVHEHLAEGTDAAQRLEREATAAARVAHPCVVEVREAGRWQGRPFLAMERLDGETLRARLDRTGPFSPPDAAALLLLIADGLAAVHRAGLVHRDVKAGNVMLVPLAPGHRRGAFAPGSPQAAATARLGVCPVLMDFGLAYAAEAASITRLGTVLGTLGYVAPEQASGVAEPDARADLFSLGVVAYEVLTGEAPFRASNEIATLHAVFTRQPPPPAEARPAVPGWLSALVMACLEKEPEDRPPSAQAVAGALAARVGTVVPA